MGFSCLSSQILWAKVKKIIDFFVFCDKHLQADAKIAKMLSQMEKQSTLEFMWCSSKHTLAPLPIILALDYALSQVTDEREG